MNRDQVLDHPEIREIIDQYPHRRMNIERAASQVCDGPNPVDSLKLAAEGIVQDKLTIFVSYKMDEQDAAAARALVEELKPYSTKLKFCFAENFYTGDSWQNAIEEGLHQAHWFILLLPEPVKGRTWCVYETGFFRGRRLKGRRLICLHHPRLTDLPGPIRGLRAVPAEPREVEKFLKELYVDPDPIPGMDPINEGLKPKLSEIAQTVISAIQPPRDDRKYYDYYVALEVPDPRQIPDPLAGAVVVESDEKVAENVFGRADWRGRWSELISNVRGDDRRWVAELCDAIAAVGRGELPKPIQATFRSPGREPKVFRPYLHATDNGPGGSLMVHLILLEDVSGDEFGTMPSRQKLLQSNIRFALRYRWEILEPASLASELNADQVEALLINQDRITRETYSRGIFDPGGVIELFGGADRDRVRRIHLVS
jgi:hypothetical protein